jgi:MSHA biogenesis protein MshJ
MRKQAEKLFAMVDGATLRERLLLFIALAVVLVAAIDTFFISPVSERDRKLRVTIAGQQAELDTIEKHIRSMVNARGVDPDAPTRARYEELTQQLTLLDAQIAHEQERFTSPDRMSKVLEETLHGSRGVRLVQLKSLPAETLADSAAPGGAARSEHTRNFRHGFELTVSGTYADLYAYLRTMEKLPRMYWGKAVLSVDDHPRSTLTLTVYTLSLDRIWIQV